MPIAKTFTATQTVEKLAITWRRDDFQEVGELDSLMVLDETGRSTRVDIQATYEKIMEEGGCTAEQSRQQTAGQIARVDAYMQDKWTYVYCVVKAMASMTTVDGEAAVSIEEIASDSLSGIESFTGKEYRSEIEGDLEFQVRAQLESLGFEISDADWNALPREQADDSYYSSPDTDPGEGVKPLPALPEKSDDFEFAYAYEDSGYGSYSEALIVEATCNYCGQTMCIESIENPENHDRDCEYFQTEEEKSEEEAK